MIKEFFAKLANWNSHRPQEFKEDMATRGQQIDSLARARQEEMNRLREMAEERRQQAMSNISQEDLLRRQKEDLKVNTKTEKHDQAA